MHCTFHVFDSAREFLEAQSQATVTSLLGRYAVMAHAYLGETAAIARSVQSTGMFAEGTSFVDLPVFVLPNAVVFPGQKMPLVLTSPASIACVQLLLHSDQDAVFGAVNVAIVSGGQFTVCTTGYS